MKLFLKKIKNNNLIYKLKNTFSKSNALINKNFINSNSSVSDAFCWRTDSGYKTIFKFSDILSIFYKMKNTEVEIIFYSKDNNLIKKILVNELEYSNYLTIDKNFLDGIEDYGFFYIFHKNINDESKKFIISNRCYLGFSFKENIYSFVHGNNFVKSLDIINNKIYSNLINMSFLKNKIYKVQNYFEDMTKTELFFANPSTSKIIFFVNKKKYLLKPGCAKIINIEMDKEAHIRSNCLFIHFYINNLSTSRF